MDIIEHGKFHQNIYTMKCYKCGCIFKYAENDRHGYDTIPSLAKKYVNCPECDTWCRHCYHLKGENIKK